MNRFALLTLYRSLVRHPQFALLNIGGLAVGIAVFLVLGLYVRFETSYEKWLPHHEQDYVVQTVWNMPNSPFNGAYPHTMGGLLEQMKGDFPGVTGTRVDGVGAIVIRGGIGVGEQLAWVDRDFFDLFDLRMIAGEGRRALADPTNVLIDRDIARKYFGDSNPVGQTLTLTVGDYGARQYRIAGVFAPLPHNSELGFTMLSRIPAGAPKGEESWWYHWGSTSLTTYLRFPTPAAARAFAAKMPAFIDRHGTKDLGPDPHKSMQLSLLPIADLHLTPAGHELASARQTVLTLGIVGLLTLLIAIVNYVNLATARAGLRAREVAMRKVLGASRAMLIRQFTSEAIFTTLIAALAALALAELALPLVNAAGDLTLSIPYGLVVPALVLLALLVGIGAGFYPAVLLSRFPAAAVLASARAPGGGRAGARLREVLVVMQFALATAFILGTLVLVAQTRHLRQTDLGFRRDGLIVVKALAGMTGGQSTSFLAAVNTLPMVHATTVADSAAGGSGNNNANNIEIPGQPGPGPSLRQIVTGRDFFTTYGARLLAGRFFDDRHRSDDSSSAKYNDPQAIVINRTAVPVLGFRSPQQAVGKTLGKGAPRTIIGVVDDLRFFSPHVPRDATYYTYAPHGIGAPVATLRYTGDIHAAIEAVRGAWLRTAPELPFDAASGDKQLAEFYKADEHAANLFTIGAGLAVLIGCVGLWGLASFNTTQRVKEIGIRKTLGASTGDIVRLLIGQFMRPVLIANLIAWPLAYLAMDTWLTGFDDRIALSPIYFLAATLLALAIAVLTVAAQSLRAAQATPAWALRHE